MADITLKAYLAHLDDLLGRRQYEEAEAHCAHILAKYPKNLSTLRRLAKAQLESGRYAEAEQTYSTVLSMEPRSAEAYIGLSWVARQRGHGDQTVALLERAYEQDTNNQEVVQLLRDAHRTFNDRANARLPQTQFIAARQQWRSGLGQQAIATLNGSLAADPARADLRLLKAQIHAQMGDAVEAARAATDVLKQLPDCVEANRILAEFWKSQGRPSDAQRFVSRIEAAEPFLAFEIATGAPPPEDALSLSLLDYRTTAMTNAAAMATPDWLGELSKSDLGKPEPTQLATPRVDLGKPAASALDWIDPNVVLEDSEPTDKSWLAEADKGADMPDDLSWLTEDSNVDSAGADADFADFAAALGVPNEEPADAAMGMDWLDGDSAEDGDTMASVSTRMVEEEQQNQVNLSELAALTDEDAPAEAVQPEVDVVADEPLAEPGEQSEPLTAPENDDWLQVLGEASSDPTSPERPEDFDDFLKNFTSFGELAPEKAQSSGTGLTGLLSSLKGPDAPVSPDVADIDPEDPLAWMRDPTVREASEEDMPDLDALLGEQPDEVAAAAMADAISSDEDPLAWMKGHDVEMNDQPQAASLWDDPLGVEDLRSIDQADVDPLAWAENAGVDVDGIEPESESDPLAWAKEDGIDLLENVSTANYTQTATLAGELAELGASASEEPSPLDELTTANQPPPPGMTGLLAFIKDGETDAQGDTPMSDHDLPDWLNNPEDKGDEAKKDDPGDLAEFDWMAVAPSEADAEIDWDAAPEAEAAGDESAPEWLAALENPVDAAEAAALSASDDPDMPNIWDDAADDSAGDMPAWMAALRDDPAADAPEASADAADWVFSDPTPVTSEAVDAHDDLLVAAAQDEIAAAQDEAVASQDQIATTQDELAVAQDDTAAALGATIDGQAEQDETGAIESTPDWLNAIAPADAEAAGDLADEPAPDWLSAVAPEAAELADTGTELGMDWLNAAAAAEVSGDDEAMQDAVAAADDSANFDWLSAAAPGEQAAGAAAELDWLNAAGTESGDVGEMADQAGAGDSLEWLAADEDADRAVSPEFLGGARAEEATGDFDFGTLDDAPVTADAEFLADLAEAGAAASIGEAAEPSFELSFLEEDSPTEDVATVELEGDPLPDWLMENRPDSQSLRMDVDVPEEQLEAAGGLSGEILDDADLLEAEPPSPETLTASAVNSPDWLNAMVPGLEVGTDALDDEELTSESEFLNGGRSDFGWLTGIVDEELAPPAMAAPSRRAARYPFSEPPLWLQMLREETQGTTPVMDGESDEDGLPDWLKFDDAETN